MHRSIRAAWLVGAIAAATLAAACSSSGGSASSPTTSSAASAGDVTSISVGAATGSSGSSSPAGESSPSAAGVSSAASPSSSEPPSSSAPASTSAAATVPAATITYWNYTASGGHEKDLAAIVSAFESANPTIKVQVQNIAYADYFTKLQTAVAAGSAPDTFELDYQDFVSYQANGAIAPISGVDASLYRKSLWDSFAAGSKQYGLPEDFSDVVLFYNKKLFQDAGVALPTASWTWSQEKAAAQKLTDKAKGIWGDFQPITYNEFYKALAQAGGQFFNADKTAATFSSDAGVAAANWLVDKAGTVMPTVAQGSNTPNFDVDLFKNGKLAIWHTGIWEFSSLTDVPFDWDIVVEPGDTTKASAMFADAATVNAASKNQAAATKWIEFLTSSDAATKIRLDSSWQLPTTSDDSKLASYLTAGKPANRQAVFDALNQVVLPPTITSQQEMQDEVNNALTAVAGGRAEVSAALADAQTKVTALLGQ